MAFLACEAIRAATGREDVNRYSPEYLYKFRHLILTFTLAIARKADECTEWKIAGGRFMPPLRSLLTGLLSLGRNIEFSFEGKAKCSPDQAFAYISDVTLHPEWASWTQGQEL